MTICLRNSDQSRGQMQETSLDNTSQAFAIAYLVAFISSTLLHSILLYLTLRHPKRFLATKYDWSVCLLQLGVLVICIPCSIVITSILALDGLKGPTGNALCQLSMYGSTASLALAIPAHFLLACERYYLIIHQKAISTRFFIVTVVGFAGFLGLIWILGPLISPDNYMQMMEGEFWCFFTMISPNMRDYARTIMAVVFFLTILGLVCLIYALIFLYLNSEKTRFVSLSNDRKSAIQRRTNRALGRCILILGAFLVCYSPTTILMVYRLITQRPVDAMVDHISSVAFGLDGVITAIILFKTNPEYLQVLKQK